MVRRILSVAAFALLVEGCSGAQTSAIPNPGVNAAQRQLTGHFAGARPAVTESILHEFTSTPDGAGPYAGLVNVKGTLYGTTTGGGTTGYGTVFKISPSGKLSVLYSFSGTTDGANPYGNLVDVNGTLYGTTAFAGGSGCYGSGCGTVFKITTSGKESTIYSFKGGSTDGAFPEAGLIYVKGALYGTTAGGGTNSAGSVFKLTTSGKETVLHIFTAGADGVAPLASLVNLNGTLYGTTELGGTGTCSGIQGAGCGIVFKVTSSGKESTLFTFPGTAANGEFPFAGLTVVKGALYGTTLNGGVSNIGIVFKMTMSGTETVLYSFKDSAGDGNEPASSLLDIKGTLYGTTTQGGSASVGAVYRITTAGQETLLYSFAGYPSDGWQPTGGVTKLGGKLYGTTNLGGSSTSCYNNFGPTGCGVVYSLAL